MNQAINLINEMIKESADRLHIYTTGALPKDIRDDMKILVDFVKSLSSLPSDTQWIDVKEDPGQAGEYLIFDPEDSRCTDYFIRGKWEYTNPTHWMPLPTPPNN